MVRTFVLYQKKAKLDNIIDISILITNCVILSRTMSCKMLLMVDVSTLRTGNKALSKLNFVTSKIWRKKY